MISKTLPIEPIFACTLRDVYVKQILSGEKTYEGRIFSGPFARYKLGTKVRWFAGSKSCVVTEVTDLQRFRSFEEMIEKIGYSKLLPQASSVHEAVTTYLSIPRYRERALQYGVVAFGVKVIPDVPRKLKRERSEQS